MNKISPTNQTALSTPGVPAGSDWALRRLIRAIIGNACTDATRGGQVGQDARAWLVGEDCALYCEFVNFNHGAILAWARAGFPDWRNHLDGKKTGNLIKPDILTELDDTR